jgi:hypothetical protein
VLRVRRPVPDSYTENLFSSSTHATARAHHETGCKAAVTEGVQRLRARLGGEGKDNNVRRRLREVMTRGHRCRCRTRSSEGQRGAAGQHRVSGPSSRPSPPSSWRWYLETEAPGSGQRSLKRRCRPPAVGRPQKARDVRAR